jgi:hypothetical protein
VPVDSGCGFLLVRNRRLDNNRMQRGHIWLKDIALEHFCYWRKEETGMYATTLRLPRILVSEE